MIRRKSDSIDRSWTSSMMTCYDLAENKEEKGGS